jgi:endonuclease/exonuclease/phosphatase family metal-dependent hydrolase
VSAWLPLAAVCWLAFVAVHTLLAGRFWLWLVTAPVPPLAFLAVPLLLLAPLLLPRRTQPGGPPGEPAGRAPEQRPEQPAGRVPEQPAGRPAGRVPEQPAGRPAGRVPTSWARPAARRRVGLAAVAAGLALGLPQAGLNVAALGHRGQPAVPAGAVRVVAWNTGYWDLDDDPGQFTDYLAGLHADVYLLQEYLARDGGAIDDQARLARDFPGYTVVVKHELVVLSRLPVVAVPPLRPRSALRVDVRAGGRPLSLYDVHVPIQADYRLSPMSVPFYLDLAERSASRRFLLGALAADVRGNPQPLLVAGDFNTTPAMGQLRTLTGGTEDAARASRQLYPVSWRISGLHLWRLDWALTGNGVRVHRYELRDPAGLSDHDAQDVAVTLPD